MNSSAAGISAAVKGGWSRKISSTDPVAGSGRESQPAARNVAAMEIAARSTGAMAPGLEAVDGDAEDADGRRGATGLVADMSKPFVASDIFRLPEVPVPASRHRD
ncbi:MAG: hypothetical protein LBT40_17030 [Deltaproteobacteria bacterium]|jgi:hypothetical protein|nr:hypothetical protein [Deltaproteobacteria bacterium]